MPTRLHSHLLYGTLLRNHKTQQQDFQTHLSPNLCPDWILRFIPLPLHVPWLSIGIPTLTKTSTTLRSRYLEGPLNAKESGALIRPSLIGLSWMYAAFQIISLILRENVEVIEATSFRIDEKTFLASLLASLWLIR